jgi:P2 family phage contractile tail tube protein
MAVNVNRIANANIYVNGANLLGMAEEVTFPKPKHKFVDHKGLGMAGTGEFWAGIDKLESKIKWASIYPQVEAIAASPFSPQAFQVRGNIMTYNSQGLAAQVPVVCFMTGVFKEGGDLMFKQHENVDYTSTITVYHSEMYVSGTQVFLFDLLSNQYVVNGVDLLAQFRANIGG